jgi:hypothetical protein
VPWVAYGAATAVGFSRITLQAHFAYDVFAGAVFGYVIRRFVVLRGPDAGFSTSNAATQLKMKIHLSLPPTEQGISRRREVRADTFSHLSFGHIHRDRILFS